MGQRRAWGRGGQVETMASFLTSAPYVSRLINKKEGIINKVFVDMLDKLGYDIQRCFLLLARCHVGEYP